MGQKVHENCNCQQGRSQVFASRALSQLFLVIFAGTNKFRTLFQLIERKSATLKILPVSAPDWQWLQLKYYWLETIFISAIPN